MKQEDIKKSFDSVEPSDRSKQRMLNHVLYHANDKGREGFMKSFHLRKAIPVCAVALVLAGSLMIHGLMSNTKTEDMAEGAKANDSDLINRETGDMAAVIDQFKIGNRNYMILSEDGKSEFGFPGTISAKDIGDRITTITDSMGNDLKGREVYQYRPAGGEAVVAVKMDKEYTLFKFFTFDSYNNNQDEDVKEYLALYGIHQGEDISKIQFIGHSDQAKIQGRLDIISEITDRGRITEFYNYYSVIKNGSDQYFNKLFNYKSTHMQGQGSVEEPHQGSVEEPPVLPPDAPDGAAVDLPVKEAQSEEIHYAEDGVLIYDTKPVDTPTADRESGSDTDKREAEASAGSAGSVGDALFNSVTIRIYNQSGVYFDAEYYPNIGFISRHEVNDDFARFLKDSMGY